MTAIHRPDEPITLALPKGRLFDQTSELLTKVGYDLHVGKRRLVAEDESGRLRAILVKNSDLPTYVHHGIAGLGICGSDVIFESGFEFFELLTMPFGSTRICLAGRKETPLSPELRNALAVESNVPTSENPIGDKTGPAPIGDRLAVATKFTRFTRQFFNSLGVSVDIINLNGSVELAPVLGLAPYIVDLVETGSTLKAHNLEIKAQLGHTSVKLIANPAFYKYHFSTVDRFVKQIGSLLTTTE